MSSHFDLCISTSFTDNFNMPFSYTNIKLVSWVIEFLGSEHKLVVWKNCSLVSSGHTGTRKWCCHPCHSTFLWATKVRNEHWRKFPGLWYYPSCFLDTRVTLSLEPQDLAAFWYLGYHFSHAEALSTQWSSC